LDEGTLWFFQPQEGIGLYSFLPILNTSIQLEENNIIVLTPISEKSEKNRSKTRDTSVVKFKAKSRDEANDWLTSISRVVQGVVSSENKMYNEENDCIIQADRFMAAEQSEIYFQDMRDIQSVQNFENMLNNRF
jgi:hypothetical protein